MTVRIMAIILLVVAFIIVLGSLAVQFAFAFGMVSHKAAACWYILIIVFGLIFVPFAWVASRKL